MKGGVQALRMMLGEYVINFCVEDICGRTAVYTATTLRKVLSIRVLLYSEEDINCWTYVYSYRMVLGFAVSRGNTEVVKLLLERGADFKRLDRGGRSTPSIAVATGDGGIVRILFKAGAKILAGSSGPILAGSSGPLVEAPLTFAQCFKD
ncbi:hypothetical protein HOY80DRAFT_1022826 [Tuber brumale]|nr:hypothetical protein HOY80DRAFT_1022826 [Tuber brumale]